MIGVIFVDDMSVVVNKFSEILKDKDIDLNEVLRNFSASSNNSSDNSSTNNSDNVDNSSVLFCSFKIKTKTKNTKTC